MSLSCSICTEIFEKPRILVCGHTLCEKCIHGLIRNSTEKSMIDNFFVCLYISIGFDLFIKFLDVIHCPWCRCRTEIKNGNIQTMPINIELQSETYEKMEN